MAGWLSWLERRIHNPEVVGSGPTPATILTKRVSIVESLFFIFVVDNIYFFLK